ncbi:MAG TPA: tryptophan synthase subunit alpha, partial [Rhizomicrobium sp.]|nr:tryptophan synthase subunit alpha [Rhizomicrobium sp.]
VSITGVTGTKDFAQAEVEQAVARIKAKAHLPVAVGFGIKTPEQAAQIARFADGAVVGSAIVTQIAEGLRNGAARAELAQNVLKFCTALAQSVHAARA